jgi:thioesterase domain-containing protein
MTDLDSLQQLDAHYQAMPPVAAMQVAIAEHDGTRLLLRAPLAVHVNDKGCAFGGSLVSLMTLAGWGLVFLQLQEAGRDADIFVADSQVRYLAPLYADLVAEATFAPDASVADFLRTLDARGRARIALQAQVPLPEGGVATAMQAQYVAIRRRADAPAAGA